MRPGYWPPAGGPIEGDAAESQGGKVAADEAARVLASEESRETAATKRLAIVDRLATFIETAPVTCRRLQIRRSTRHCRICSRRSWSTRGRSSSLSFV